MDKNIQNSFRVITHLGGGKGKNMTEVVSSMDKHGQTWKKIVTSPKVR